MRYVNIGSMEVLIPECHADGKIRVSMWGSQAQRDGLLGTSILIPSWEARRMAALLLHAADEAVEHTHPEDKVIVVEPGSIASGNV